MPCIFISSIVAFHMASTIKSVASFTSYLEIQERRWTRFLRDASNATSGPVIASVVESIHYKFYEPGIYARYESLLRISVKFLHFNFNHLKRMSVKFSEFMPKMAGMKYLPIAMVPETYQNISKSREGILDLTSVSTYWFSYCSLSKKRWVEVLHGDPELWSVKTKSCVLFTFWWDKIY